MDKKAIFFQNLMKGKQMSTLNLSTQEKQSIAKLISNYKIGMDYIPRISNKINLGFDSIFKEIIIYRSFTYAFTLILRIL